MPHVASEKMDETVQATARDLQPRALAEEKAMSITLINYLGVKARVSMTHPEACPPKKSGWRQKGTLAVDLQAGRSTGCTELEWAWTSNRP